MNKTKQPQRKGENIIQQTKTETQNVTHTHKTKNKQTHKTSKATTKQEQRTILFHDYSHNNHTRPAKGKRKRVVPHFLRSNFQLHSCCCPLLEIPHLSDAIIQNSDVSGAIPSLQDEKGRGRHVTCRREARVHGQRIDVDVVVVVVCQGQVSPLKRDSVPVIVRDRA